MDLALEEPVGSGYSEVFPRCAAADVVAVVVVVEYNNFAVCQFVANMEDTSLVSAVDRDWIWL